MTDIKEIIPIIEKNIEINQEIIKIGKGSLLPLILNWSFEKEEIKTIFQKNCIEKIDYILCSDVIFNDGQLDLFINVIFKKIIYKFI